MFKNSAKKALRWVLMKSGIKQVRVPVRMYNNESRYTLSSDCTYLQAKTAFVTGANGSIGRAITAVLISRGAHVYVTGRNETCLRELESEMNNLTPGSCTALVLDLNDEEEVKTKVQQVVEVTKSLDIWVNCAGGSARAAAAPIAKQNMEVVDYVMSSNLRLCIIGSKVAAVHMTNQQYGSIINISSAIGDRGKKNFSDYAAAKAGIIGFSRSLALEVGPSGVTVNCVSPGFIQRGEYDENRRDYLLRSNCMHAIGTPEDVAHAVAFLASPHAKFITGQNIMVDGGRSLGLMGDS